MTWKKNILSVLVLVVAIVLSIWSFQKLPEQMVMNNNEISRWFIVLFIPAVMAFMFVLMQLLPFIATNNNNHLRIQSSMDVIVTISLVILVFVHGMLIADGLGHPMNLDLIGPLVTGVTFIVVGNYMPRFKQNGHVGGQINMTIREDVRRKIQLVFGRIFVVGGLGMLLVTLLPSKVVIPTFVAVLLISVLTVLGSSFYYLKIKSAQR
ncbi:hypothetical protein [Paenibacillus sp. IHBB 10380]|uniref:hypothetical protein n=1 Tax=Paenibacillus sp. IHBB 10380 TaxID=1566358 RepID=UPI0005CFCD59|nr:hypothetical protein [Paenibacillus sp. IHBB 10380]AJS59086.1 hypothetical protein UB51_12160 [Paenibacillus sp. IHBB 10380]